MEILKVYNQEIPKTRFIGIKYNDSDRVNGSFSAKWEEAFQNGLFEKIYVAGGGEESCDSFFTDSGAYIGLMRCNNKDFEYYIGMFVKPCAEVPKGLSFIDFEPSRLGIGWVYGNEKNGELYCHEGEVFKRLIDAGMKAKTFENGFLVFFERYQCPRFTTPDEKCNVILDICLFIE